MRVLFKNVYCKDHRIYKEHNCTGFTLGKRVFVCPSCNKGVEIIENQDWNAIYDTHVAIGECTSRVIDKCKVRGCKATLTHINSLTCNRCHQKTCLVHRYPDSHNCSNTLCKQIQLL